MHRTILIPFTVLMLGHGSQVIGADDPVSTLRGELETSFRSQTGLGFKAFSCDVSAGRPLPPEFECNAEDEEGDRFLYRLWAGDSRSQSRMSMWQPVSQLQPDGLAWLEAPIQRFVTAFSAGDWAGLANAYVPALAEAFPPEAAAASLAPLLRAAGPLKTFRSQLYSSSAAGVHTLEISIEGERDSLTGRFRLQGGEAGDARITALIVRPVDGSALAVQMLRETARSTLSGVLGQNIREVALPLEHLRRTGDAVEGEVSLEDGTSIAVRGAQTSPTTDFGFVDYGFQVLEADWIISAHLASNGDPDAAVSCPARTVPDGGELNCDIRHGDDSRSRASLRRKGGEHRLFPAGQ